MKSVLKSSLPRTGVLGLLAIALVSWSEAASWNKDLESPIVASPITRDIDRDGDKEILISTLVGNVYLLDDSGETIAGWPQATSFLQRTSPNLGDIDGDGALDVVIGDHSGKVHAWELNGSIKTGFPIQLEGTIQSAVRLIDFDQDGSCELLVHTGESRLYLLDSSGKSLPGWPINLGGSPDRFGSWITASTPEVVDLDLDLDGQLEIAIGTTGSDVQVFDLKGKAIQGWPKETGGLNYPSVIAVDIDGDDSPELICPSEDGKLYAWTANGQTISGFPIAHDSAIIASVAVGELSHTHDGLELVVADLSGKVYSYTNQGQLLDGWPKAAASGIIGSPLIVDVNSDGQSEVLVPSRDNWLHIWEADGTAIESQALKANDWIEATPVADDIDQNGKLEILFASYDGLLRCSEWGSARNNPNEWTAFRNDAHLQADRPSFDCDRDQLPDRFEYTYLGGLESKGTDDSDRDGSTNADEWTAGTDPGKAGERFNARIRNVQIEQRTGQAIEWDAKTGRTYRIEYSNNLYAEDVDWIRLEELDNIHCQVDETICIELLPAEEQLQGFYRVVVERTQ